MRNSFYILFLTLMAFSSCQSGKYYFNYRKGGYSKEVLAEKIVSKDSQSLVIHSLPLKQIACINENIPESKEEKSFSVVGSKVSEQRNEIVIVKRNSILAVKKTKSLPLKKMKTLNLSEEYEEGFFSRFFFLLYLLFLLTLLCSITPMIVIASFYGILLGLWYGFLLGFLIALPLGLILLYFD